MNPHIDDSRMSLGDHLEELRRRLFKGLIGPFLFAVILMFFAEHIFSFLVQPLYYELGKQNFEQRLIATTLMGPFYVYLKISLVGGLVLGIPWLLYHLWCFISPGLYENERRFVVYLLPGSALLSIMGFLFMYYVMLPLTIWFLIGFTSAFPQPSNSGSAIQERLHGEVEVVESVEGDAGGGSGGGVLGDLPLLTKAPADLKDGAAWIQMPEKKLMVVIDGEYWGTSLKKGGSGQLLEPMISAPEYINLVMLLTLAFSIAFQLPLVMLMLAWVGIVNYEMMAGSRKFALLGVVIFGALLTPPDPLSQLSMAVPMYALYEVGLILVLLFASKKKDEDAQEDTSAD